MNTDSILVAKIMETPMGFLKHGTLATYLILLGSSVLSEDRQDSLFARLERPATVAAHHSPSSFAKYLDKVNERETVLVPSKEGSAAFEADVWILFFEDESEIGSMPEIIQEIYAAMPKFDDNAVSQYVEFELSEGGPKAASFHFLDRYSTDSEEVIACKAAIDVYSGVKGEMDIAKRKDLTAQCNNVM